MKIKSIIALLLVCVLPCFFTACGETEEKVLCVICKNEATRTISGTEYTMEKYGIDINLCAKTSSTPPVYTAHICSSCVDLPVVKNPLVNNN